jgi:hypothetical protein
MVAGTARSGTTWLGDLIASQLSCRILFEPFNPNLVQDYQHFKYFQYMRPGTVDPELYAFCFQVLSGVIRNSWVDHQNERIFSKYRLIKEIRANLELKWIHDNFPQVPIIFILRHPCAVVASRMELGWSTDGDIEPLLSQPHLLADFLEPFIDLIKRSKSAEAKHAIIWSISNLVPLKQFGPGELQIVNYETLCSRPDIALPEALAALGVDYSSSALSNINRPSQTTRANSAVVIGTDKISAWRHKLTCSQIEEILTIVDAFGLGYLYSDSSLPLENPVP